MAMFVLVVDTSLMNVSISAVVQDLNTTVSGVQSAIALEALVSAAFILIGGKIGDLYGRKRAYVLGLLGYAAGAVAMAFAQGLTALIVFWAIIGGLGASLLLPSMQSLIHGNFEGAERTRAYAQVGAAAAIATAVGPLLGGFITTYLSWRVGFLLEAVLIAIVLSGIHLVRDVPYTGPRQVDALGAVLSVLGMGGIVLGILVWQEGGERVASLLAIGVIALAGLVYWLRRRKRRGEPTLLDPQLFESMFFRLGISQQMLQQIALGGMIIALPIYLQMVLEYNALQAGLSLAPLSLSMFGMALLAGRRAGKRRPASIVLLGFASADVAVAALIAIVPRATSGLELAIPLIFAGCGLGLLVSQLNNYTLSPIYRGARQRGRRRELRGRLVRAVIRVGVRRRDHARNPRAHLHQHGAGEPSAPSGGEGAGRDGAGGRRADHEQYPAPTAAGDSAARDTGGDHSHQHRGQTSCAPGGAAGSTAGRPGWALQRDADEATAGPDTVRSRRGSPRRLTNPSPNSWTKAGDRDPDASAKECIRARRRPLGTGPGRAADIRARVAASRRWSPDWC